jgi:predicted type IV restriction endonuclease
MALGWNVFEDEEVCPEYSVQNGRVDYSLRSGHFNKVFIEVKKNTENLENHQEQLLQYSFKEGVKLAILTNGLVWWFYLPLHEGSWEQRKFNSIDIIEQDTSRICEKFRALLLKNEVISGNAVINAENYYNNRLKGEIIKSTLVKTWVKLVEQQDEILIDLIAEATERLCGYKPDNQTVKEFIPTLLFQLSSNTILPIKSREKKVEIETNTEIKVEIEPVAQSNSNIENELNDFTGKNISSIIFLGKKYGVRTFKDILTKVVEIILEKTVDKEKIFTVTGTKRPYFTYNQSELRYPRELKIQGRKIYVETNFSGNKIISVLNKVLELYGYRIEDLQLL